jgi:UDP-N-acetyl-D-glucosamine dehydrogenase
VSKVLVLGLGYVGLPLAIRAAQVGHSVVGLDVDTNKLDALNRGKSYIEDVTDEQLQMEVNLGRFVAVSDVAYGGAFDLAIITVPTPLRDGVPDLSYVESAGHMVGSVMAKGCSVVLESTTFPGTTEGLLKEILQEDSGLTAGVDFHLGFSPERIDPGPTGNTLQNTPKLVSATTPEGLMAIKGFYDTIVDVTVPVSSPRVAEMTKIFENLQANVLIGLINETSKICHDLDIDVWEMVDASMTKGHSMSRWTPGPGVGGHCLPIDPMYLAWLTRAELGYSFKFAELADEINSTRPFYVFNRVKEMLNDQTLAVKGTDVLVLGVAYKPNVGDCRESPALPLVDALVSHGAQVTICDPHVTDWTKTKQMPLSDMEEQIGSFPITIVVTDHDEFDYNMIADNAPAILDCRNAVPSRPHVEAL